MYPFLQAHAKLPLVLAQVAFASQLLPRLHSLISKQLNQSPENPFLQEHSNDPKVFWQLELESHGLS